MHIALQLQSELCWPSSDGRRLDVSEILRVIDEPATGFVGTIAVSGLPQREDHCLVVEAIAESLGAISPTSHCHKGELSA